MNKKYKRLKIIIFILIAVNFALVNSLWAEEMPSAIDTPVEAQQTVDDIPDAEIVVNPPPSFDLPDYPKDSVKFIGKMQRYKIGEEDTLMDIARNFTLGYVELLTANEPMDAWAPIPDTEIIIPSKHIIPRTEIKNGIIVNLGEMRIFYLKDGKSIKTFPIGIGRDGLHTPIGRTTIVRKKQNPNWYPTKRMRDADPKLPWKIEAGPQNPLGKHALYLGWAEYLIHGTNKPWGIGRRVSSGCIRMYPENAEELFTFTPIGTEVEVVDQPIKIAWLDSGLYIEAHPTATQSDAIEKKGYIPYELIEDEISEELQNFIKKIAGDDKAKKLNWEQIKIILKERRGYPIKILDSSKENDKNNSK